MLSQLNPNTSQLFDYKLDHNIEVSSNIQLYPRTHRFEFCGTYVWRTIKKNLLHMGLWFIHPNFN